MNSCTNSCWRHATMMECCGSSKQCLVARTAASVATTGFKKCCNSTAFNQLNSIQFDSIRFDSIRFDSIRFNSIQFNSIHMTGFSTSQHLTMYLEDSCPKLHSSQKEWYTPCWKAWVKRRSGSGYVCSSWDELGATCLIAFKVDNEFHIHVAHLTTLSLL